MSATKTQPRKNVVITAISINRHFLKELDRHVRGLVKHGLCRGRSEFLCNAARKEMAAANAEKKLEQA